MRVMIFSPHLDDEVLSCSSFLDGQNDITIFYGNTQHCFCDDEVVQKENRELIDFLKCEVIYSRYRFDINRLDRFPSDSLIGEYGGAISEVEPDMVILPYPSYNQDHRVTHEVVLTAVRPHDKNFFVKKVLLWEEPETFGTLRKGEPFRPNYFRWLDIANKLKLNNFYQSQLRGHRSWKDLQAIAEVRGMQSNNDFAEAFEIVRWVE